MSETKQLLILANSARVGGHCVAGRIATPAADGNFDVGQQWVRLTHPTAKEGAVPGDCVLCPGHGPARPLDFIEVTLTGRCQNPDHPEDWFFDPSVRWKYLGSTQKASLPQILDQVPPVWCDGIAGSVAAGYVAHMQPQPASLSLARAPAKATFTFYKKTVPDANNPGQTKTKYVRYLSFTHAGRYHEFSVTDPEFLNRHKVWDQMTESPQVIQLPETPDLILCLSLGAEFRGRLYKICATIFEP